MEKTPAEIWIEKAKFRQDNKDWLEYSRKIALRILSGIEDISGMNQSKLAKQVGVSEQQISKIVKGGENLTLQTIAKISKALNIDLIEFPSFKYNCQSTAQLRTELTEQYATIENLASRIVELEGALREITESCGTVNFSSHNQMREAVECSVEIADKALKGGTKE